MSESGWHCVAKVDDVAPEEPLKVVVGDIEIALFNLDGEIHATDNICTHAYASLADGFQEGGEIECPLHEGRFDIRTGKALCPPVTEDLKTYAVKVENEEVFVDIPA